MGRYKRRPFFAILFTCRLHNSYEKYPLSPLRPRRLELLLSAVKSSIHGPATSYCDVTLTDCSHVASMGAFVSECIDHMAMRLLEGVMKYFPCPWSVKVWKFSINWYQFIDFFASDDNVTKLFHATGPMLIVVTGNWIYHMTTSPIPFWLCASAAFYHFGWGV